MEEFDAIVIGAGTPSCIANKTVAQHGLSLSFDSQWTQILKRR